MTDGAMIMSVTKQGGWFGLGADTVYRVSCPIPDTNKFIIVTVTDDGVRRWCDVPPTWLHTEYERAEVILAAREAVRRRVYAYNREGGAA